MCVPFFLSLKHLEDFFMRKYLFASLFSLCALVAWAQQYGSISPQAFAQQTQKIRNVERSIQELMSRLEAIEHKQKSLSSRIDALAKDARFASKDDLAALRADLSAIRTSQGEMRNEIVSELSEKMAKLMSQQADARKKAENDAKAKSGYEHIVEAGQTISAIAAAYKVSVQSILKANNIKDPTKVRVGQKLFIPDP
jgi:LysM repeat protein